MPQFDAIPVAEQADSPFGCRVLHLLAVNISCMILAMSTLVFFQFGDVVLHQSHHLCVGPFAALDAVASLYVAHLVGKLVVHHHFLMPATVDVEHGQQASRRVACHGWYVSCQAGIQPVLLQLFSKAERLAVVVAKINLFHSSYSSFSF